MTIELQGIELHAFHGVLEHERREGQRFLVDLELDLADTSAASTDRIEDAVDYRDVVATVVDVAEGRAYHLLEALAAARRRRPRRRLSRSHACVSASGSPTSSCRAPSSTRRWSSSGSSSGFAAALVSRSE